MKNLGAMFAPCPGIVAFFLWAERRVGSLRAFPYLLLLLCPLVHLWMHRGHGRGGNHRQGLRRRDSPAQRSSGGSRGTGPAACDGDQSRWNCRGTCPSS